MKLKWYHTVCIICASALALLGVLFAIMLFLCDLFIQGIIGIISAVVIFTIIFLIVMLSVSTNSKMVKKALGPVMVEAEGIFKINDNKSVDMFLQFCKNGLFLFSQSFDSKPYLYDCISYDIDDGHRCNVTMNIESLGRCKFTCNNALKIKAISNLLEKKCSN